MCKQAKADCIKMNSRVFDRINDTRIYWICNGGVLINSRGTCILIDPLLEGFDMPLLVDPPLLINDITHVDAVLITHCDNDHFSLTTNKKILNLCDGYHTTKYVATLFAKEKIQATGYEIHDSFMINDIKITLTPADHAWQNEKEKYASIREYQMKDYCGFWIETKDGTIWMPADSRLLAEHLTYSEPDIILLDISDSKWHLGLKNLSVLANTYSNSILIPIHWGCVDSIMPEFNGDPSKLFNMVDNPKRIQIMPLGKPYKMRLRNEK